MGASWGLVNAASLYPGKNLGAKGNAAIVTTSSMEIYRKIQLLRNYCSEQKYYHEEWGVNSRLDGLQAGILSVKLTRLMEWNAERRNLAERFR